MESVGQNPSTAESEETVSADGKVTESAGQEAADNAAESGTVQAGAVEKLGVKTEPAALTQDEPEIEMQGNTLTYGGLTVELPEGIEARPVDAQDNGNIFCTGHFLSDGNKGRILELRGAQEVYADWEEDECGLYGLPKIYYPMPPIASPRVRLFHYRAAYGSETALLFALFDFLPEATGYRMYADGSRGEYAWRLEQDGCVFFFLVREEDVYLVQEMEEEEDYGFDVFLKDGAVRWKDSGEAVGFCEEPEAAAYRKLAPEKGISLLYVHEDRSLQLYREGYYETPCQTLQVTWSEGLTQIEDVNSDGCSDIVGFERITASDEVYLWNRRTKTYEKEQTKAGDGTAPGTGDIEKQGEESGRKIPQGLLDEIANVMAAGKDAVILSRVGNGRDPSDPDFSGVDGRYGDWLNGMISGRILTQEEALVLAGRDMAVRQQVQNAARAAYSYALVEADCDNDGRADLFWQLDGHYIGGVTGTVEYVFLKGQPDGSYVKTDDFQEQRESFNVIAYEGKNYLCCVDFDSDRMIYNGYTVRRYEDGKRVEEAAVHMVPERYEIRRISAQEGYEKLQAEMTEKCTAVKEKLDQGQRMTGGAEQAVEDLSTLSWNYICDLDNDGLEEEYDKSVWRFVLFDGWARMGFHVTKSGGEKEQRGITMLSEEIEDSTDTPMELWAETYEGKNIVHVLYMTGLDDFRIAGYLVEENGYSKVYEIQADAVYRVEQVRREIF